MSFLTRRSLKYLLLWFIPGAFTLLLVSAPFQEVGSDLPLASQQIDLLIGPSGTPLPFQNNDEIEDFLRTAEIKKTETVSTGINRVEKLLLERDGVQMNAVFRDVDIRKTKVKTQSGWQMDFRDNCRYECAAYTLSRMLGLDCVPPTVVRKVNRSSGTIQIWIERAKMESERLEEKINPPDVERWNLQIQTMRLFDNLIYNDDRNQGNLLIDHNWKVWLIDHTRAFRTHDKPPTPQIILQCDEEVWRNLQSLTKEILDEKLDEYLRDKEIKAILKRRDLLVEHIQDRIDKLGEENVLFSLY